MKRYEDEIERALRKIRAASFTLLDHGGTEAEAQEAMNAGIAEAQAMAQRAADRAAEVPAVRPTRASRGPRHSAEHRPPPLADAAAAADRLWAALGRAS